MKTFLKNKWILITFIVGITLIIVLFTLFFTTDNETKEEEVKLEESLIEIENTVIATQKVNDFILERIPSDEVFLKFHLENGKHHDLTKEEYETAALEMFYGAISEENVSYLTTALTPESFQMIWGEEMDFEKREIALQDYLNQLNGNDTLTGMSYKLKLDKYDAPTGDGTILLNYKDDSIREVPFTFVTVGEGHHQITQLNLNEIYQIDDTN